MPIIMEPGQIIRVDPVKNTVSVKSFVDGSIIDNVAMDSPHDDVRLPIVGTRCVFYREGQYTTRIGFLYSSKISIQKGNPGERSISSDADSFMRVTNDKKAGHGAGISDATATQDGYFINSDEIQLQTVKNTSVYLKLDGSIVILRAADEDPDKTLLHITITPEGNLQIKGGTLYLEGTKVALGPGALDDFSRALFGNVVTAGPTGTHPFDFITGLPITGSANVTSG